MWRPDPAFDGPFRPADGDIASLNDAFALSFTDRYRRDGLPNVRVPHLNRAVWEFAIADAGEGAMIWRDRAGRVVAFNLAHCSGHEGWMGPLAVRPDLQGRGLGTRVVREAIAWLEAAGARTIGLETMPRTVDNIGFYAGLGFRPGALTITLVRDRLARPGADLRPAGTADLEACHALVEELAPGRDYRREVDLTRRARLGDVSLVKSGDRVVAWALWHDAPLAASRPGDEVRILKAVARDLEALERLGDAVAAATATVGRSRVGLRCETADPSAYARLQAAGWRTHWTDLRMTLATHPEIPPRQGVVWSNWEV